VVLEYPSHLVFLSQCACHGLVLGWCGHCE
jgi:hypothetical protein